MTRRPVLLLALLASVAVLIATVGIGGLALAARTAAGTEPYPVLTLRGEYPDTEVLIDRGDGAGPQVLAKGSEPDLSPDGTRVVFHARTEHECELRVISSAGTDERTVLWEDNLPYGLGGSIEAPVWAPDGEHILFDCLGGMSGNIGIVDADGTNARKFSWGAKLGGAWPSALSPDRTRILIRTGFDEGLGVAMLSYPDATFTQIYQYGDKAAWSLDGTMIAVTRSRIFVSTTCGLLVYSPDGSLLYNVGAAIPLVDGRTFCPAGEMSWSADGREVAVANAVDGQLYAVRIDGTGWRPVTSHFPATPTEQPTLVQRASWAQVKGALP